MRHHTTVDDKLLDAFAMEVKEEFLFELFFEGRMSPVTRIIILEHKLDPQFALVHWARLDEVELELVRDFLDELLPGFGLIVVERQIGHEEVRVANKERLAQPDFEAVGA